MRTSAWIGATVLCAALGCQGAAAPARSEAPRAAPHELVIEGVELERWVEGRLRLSARARAAVVDRRARLVAADDVELVARGPDGSERGRLAGRRLEAALDGKGASLVGDVRLDDPMGRTLSATAATYRAADDRVEAPGRVELRGRNFVVTGRHLEADLERGEVRVDGPVDARVEP